MQIDRADNVEVASLVENSAMEGRAAIKSKHDATPYIISVGNIAMGGTGKTPHTLHIAKHFQAEGECVSILSLGYKGEIGYDTHVISDGRSLLLHPPLAADEPYMMAKELFNVNDGRYAGVVITGKKRLASYEVARRKFGSTVVILDDGFQHRQMPRDLDIVLLDYKRPISTGFPIPFGYLRQFPSALKNADIIIFTRAESSTIPPRAKRYCEGKVVYFSRGVYDSFIGESVKIFPLDMKSKRVWLMSGIANAAQFEAQVADTGAVVLGHSRFKDHHLYTGVEIQNVIKASAQGSADLIVTTQKDYVKIPEQHIKKFVYPEMTLDIVTEGGEWRNDGVASENPLLKELKARVREHRERK